MKKQIFMFLLPAVFLSVLIFFSIKGVKTLKPESSENIGNYPTPAEQIIFENENATKAALIRIREKFIMFENQLLSDDSPEDIFLPPQLNFGFE